MGENLSLKFIEDCEREAMKPPRKAVLLVSPAEKNYLLSHGIPVDEPGGAYFSTHSAPTGFGI